LKPSRIVFIGATRFTVRCIECAVSLPDCELAGVVTVPEVFQISYRPEGVRNVLYADVGEVAERHGVQVVTHDRTSDRELLLALESWRPDVVLVSGWYHLIPKSVRAVAPVLGMHASLLPDYSGGAPLVWAIINDETQCGITLFQMDDGVDSGPIVGQAPVPILFTDTIATLYERVEDAGLALLRRELPRVCRGEAALTPQDERRRRRFPQRAPSDGEIAWSWPARRIYNFVRAQTRPYPGAFTRSDGGEIRVWAATLTDRRVVDREPGSVIRHDGDHLDVVCGDGVVLRVTDIERPVRDGVLLG
jgi:methionyl-tRNA formyltransferase